MGVVVVGSLNVDLAADVDLLPRPGETVASTGPLRRSAGGKGLNQAIAAARQGVATRLAGAVGDDDDGRMLLALLRAEGVETEAIVTSRSSSTGTALITVDARGDNTIVVVAGANGTLAPPASAQLAVGPGDVVLAQLEVPIATVTAVLTRAHDAAATTILNASPAMALPDELAAAVDLLVVNEHELATTGLGAAPPSSRSAHSAHDCTATRRHRRPRSRRSPSSRSTRRVRATPSPAPSPRPSPSVTASTTRCAGRARPAPSRPPGPAPPPRCRRRPTSPQCSAEFVLPSWSPSTHSRSPLGDREGSANVVTGRSGTARCGATPRPSRRS